MDLVAYKPFNAFPSSDVISSTSSDFQPNITRPITASPSTHFMPPIYVKNVEKYTTAMVATMHYTLNRAAKDKQQPDHTVEAHQQPDYTVNADQQADNTVDADQQADHTAEADQQADHTVDADQQAVHTVNDCSGEGLRLRFINLHLQHMEFLETEM
ncbi:hypothetical protein BGZ96_004377, partial [Linnemannia gamsii]